MPTLSSIATAASKLRRQLHANVGAGTRADEIMRSVRACESEAEALGLVPIHAHQACRDYYRLYWQRKRAEGGKPADKVHALVIAGRNVVSCWSKGDLAEAVRILDAELSQFQHLD